MHNVHEKNRYAWGKEMQEELDSIFVKFSPQGKAPPTDWKRAYNLKKLRKNPVRVRVASN